MTYEQSNYTIQNGALKQNLHIEITDNPKSQNRSISQYDTQYSTYTRPVTYARSITARRARPVRNAKSRPRTNVMYSLDITDFFPLFAYKTHAHAAPAVSAPYTSITTRSELTPKLHHKKIPYFPCACVPQRTPLQNAQTTARVRTA